jgi:hypothetical protein
MDDEQVNQALKMVEAACRRQLESPNEGDNFTEVLSRQEGRDLMAEEILAELRNAGVTS